MAFDFPTAPAVGDEVTLPNGAVSQWDGTKWTYSTGGTSSPPPPMVQQVDIGTMDAATGLCDYTAASGYTDGPLLAATAVVAGEYVTVTVAGTPPSGPPETLVPLEINDRLISNGTTWAHVRIGGMADNSVRLIVSDTPPAFDPKTLWYDSAACALRVPYDDGNSQQWVPAG